MRFGRLAAGAIAIVGACRSGALSPLYCEGGVGSKGETFGGECMAFTSEANAKDPNTVATARWLRAAPGDAFAVRRAGKDRYELVANGTVAGTIERDDHWIHVTMADKSGDRRLRDDAPGFFQ